MQCDFFFFYEDRFLDSFAIQYILIVVSPPSIPPSYSPPFLLSRSTPVCLSLEKDRLLRDNKIQNTKKNYHIEVGHSKPKGEKEFQEQAQELETTCSHSQEFTKKTKLIVIIYLQRTCCRPLKAMYLQFESLGAHMCLA